MLLLEESFVWVVPANHPLAKKPQFKIEDLADERFILHRPGQNTRKVIDRYLFKERITPKVAIELAETEAIKAMVARGLGVSILPESAFRYGPEPKDLKTIRISRQ